MCLFIHRWGPHVDAQLLWEGALQAHGGRREGRPLHQRRAAPLAAVALRARAIPAEDNTWALQG